MLVISNRPCALNSSDFEITRSVTPLIVLPSVQLLLLIIIIIIIIIINMMMMMNNFKSNSSQNATCKDDCVYFK